MLKRPLVVIALAAVAFLAIPSPASAVTPYVPTGPCASVTGTPAPGAILTVTYNDGCFAPGEQYDVTVTGAGVITLDGVASPSARKTATATGAGTLQLTLPMDATGTYLANAVGVTSNRTCAVKVNVASASSTAGVVTASLASTGFDAPGPALLGAGGLVLLGLALFIGLGRRHRRLKKRPLNAWV
jgi:LPXTG-motif cell wall-anchored protein